MIGVLEAAAVNSVELPAVVVDKLDVFIGYSGVTLDDVHVCGSWKLYVSKPLVRLIEAEMRSLDIDEDWREQLIGLARQYDLVRREAAIAALRAALGSGTSRHPFLLEVIAFIVLLEVRLRVRAAEPVSEEARQAA